jgi:hypothetical protein
VSPFVASRVKGAIKAARGYLEAADHAFANGEDKRAYEYLTKAAAQVDGALWNLDTAFE